MNDNIKISDKNAETFDKKQIALAIRNSSLNDTLSCSIKDDMLITSCNECSLKFICDGLDKLSKEYTEKTSTIIKKVNFL
jgi:hypothetical protein